ncbi:unnamed protein product [Plutella xylostella]|uniref:RNA-directed DNA polymerase n=1 Tax=Plutella xylostella TaxID=51655 RepID=A0A8S4G5I7_PLUXY|nr:unnamed protein product [Plutella xylostella]
MSPPGTSSDSGSLATLNIKEFDIRSGKWSVYVSQLKAWFDINQIKMAMQSKYLIAVVGPETLELIIDLCYPSAPSDVTFEDIVEKVKKHLSPKRSEIAERICFRSCKQEAGQTLSEYTARLKQLAKNCNFSGTTGTTGTTYLEENLRDQFVFGMRSDTIRFRLLTETSLTFALATELALSLEAADRDSKTNEAAAEQSRQEAVHAVHGARWPGPRAGRGQGAAAHHEARRGRGGGAGPRAQQKCYRCAGLHPAARCSFVNVECFVCGKKGHIAKVCKSRRGGNSVNNVQCEAQHNREVEDGVDYYHFDEECEDDVPVYMMSAGRDQPWWCKLSVNGIELDMQIDSGAGVSIIPYFMYKKYFGNLNILPTNISLKMYCGQKVSPVGMIKCKVIYKQSTVENLELIIVDSANKVALLGRQWMVALGINCHEYVNKVGTTATGAAPARAPPRDVGTTVSHQQMFTKLSQLFPNVFSPGIGTFNGGVIHLSVTPGAKPVYCKPRQVPYALRQAVDNELNRLETEGIISPVEVSEWGTPIVPVIKRSGAIRLCGDFKVTLNPVLEDDKYPIPRIEDIFVALQGGRLFSKIDLSHAYQQLKLSDESKMLCVIVTHLGNYCYNRLPFGVKCALSKFQRVMENLFRMKYVTIYCDDILCTGTDTVDHMNRLIVVFETLNKWGLKVEAKKCSFFQKSVSYLGYVIDAEGLHTEIEKVDAIKNTPAPQDVHRLKAFIGLVNYYAKFLPNISTILHPLHNLLRKDIKYEWSPECERAFNTIKDMLCRRPVLAHYDPARPVRVYCDASPYGVGAALTQTDDAGVERPVTHASRSLSTAEKNYAQICREGLAIIFAVHKFNHYIYGRRFILVTDCKPLAAIFSQNKAIPKMIAGRLQRWAVILSGYNYEIECIRSEENCVADALSRLPASVDKLESDIETFEFINHIEEGIAISHKDIAKETGLDPVLSKVVSLLRRNWEYCDKEELRPYWLVRESLSVEHGCVMRGARVAVPAALRGRVLAALHAAHQGAVRMKALARSYVWWPRLDADVERTCRECNTCTMESPSPPRAAIHPWAWPQAPWYRLHVDFLSPKMGIYYLVVIDSHSKWIEAFCVKSTSAFYTIRVLRETFARFGNPLELVSDSGPPFSSLEFAEFLRYRGIKHIPVSPYKPSSNGAAENTVKLVKTCLKKAVRDGADVDEALQTFLMMHRATPHCTTGRTPAELLLKRNMRINLDLLVPNAEEIVRGRQLRAVNERQITCRELEEGAKVVFKIYKNNKEFWVKGSIIKRIGPLTYLMNDGSGYHKRHIDQIMRDHSVSQSNHATAGNTESITARTVATVPLASSLKSVPVTSPRAVGAQAAPAGPALPPVEGTAAPSGLISENRPMRIRRQPNRLINEA